MVLLYWQIWRGAYFGKIWQCWISLCLKMMHSAGVAADFKHWCDLGHLKLLIQFECIMAERRGLQPQIHKWWTFPTPLWISCRYRLFGLFWELLLCCMSNFQLPTALSKTKIGIIKWLHILWIDLKNIFLPKKIKNFYLSFSKPKSSST